MGRGNLGKGIIWEMILTRWYANDCTFGVLADVVPFLVTLELPWKDNKENISCIPEGTYKGKLVNSPKHGICYELQDVPDRTDVQIHIGNYPKDTLGCILVGTEFGGDKSISNSEKAFRLLMHRLSGVKEFNLTIRRNGV